MPIRLFDFGFGRSRGSAEQEVDDDADWAEAEAGPEPDADLQDGAFLPDDNVALAGALYRAFADEDRAAAEALLADDFRFTSPYDNGLDRAAWFQRCWPNAAHICNFRFIHVAAGGDSVFVTYEAERTTGGSFRNTEVLTFRHGQLTEVEVYFGWNLPHDAPGGSFIEP